MSGEVKVTPGYVFDENGELVTLDKLNRLIADAVARLLAGSVTARELADGSINADKLDANISAQLGVGDGSVTTAKIVDGAVTEAKLADGAVAEAKLADGAVAEAKLAEESVTEAKMHPDLLASLADVPMIGQDNYYYVEDRKGNTTDGGAFSNGAWRQRTLNHEETARDWAGLASDVVTLGAGVYMVKAYAAAYQVQAHRLRLVVVRDGEADLVIEGPHYVATTDGGDDVVASVFTFVSIASSATVRVDHRCQSSKSLNGLGRSASGIGTHSIYARMHIWRLKDVD